MLTIIIGVSYVAVFILVALGELIFAARSDSRADRRLLTNFGLAASNMAIMAVLPLGVVITAAYGEARGLGLVPYLELPDVVTLALALLSLTAIQYATHRLFHAVPLFWRVHRVHHADRLMDASTALRNHPLELIPVLCLTCPAVLALGLPVWAVLITQLASFAVAVLSHANLRVPPVLSDAVSQLIVTPDFHLVHHSEQRSEHDSNYGELFTLWDRLLGTYRGCLPVKRLGLGKESDVLADRLLAQLYSPFDPARRASAAADPRSAAAAIAKGPPVAVVTAQATDKVPPKGQETTTTKP